MADKLNSLEICAALQKSGTGEEALGFLESVLHDHYVSTRLQSGVAKLLSPSDLLEKFVNHDKIDHWTGTVEKIKSLIEFGEIRAVQAVSNTRLWDRMKGDVATIASDAKAVIADVHKAAADLRAEISDEFKAAKDQIFGPKVDPVPAPDEPGNLTDLPTTYTTTKIEQK